MLWHEAVSWMVLTLGFVAALTIFIERNIEVTIRGPLVAQGTLIPFDLSPTDARMLRLEGVGY